MSSSFSDSVNTKLAILHAYKRDDFDVTLTLTYDLDDKSDTWVTLRAVQSINISSLVMIF